MAAQDHATDLGRTGDSGHKGSNGEYYTERIERYGEWEGRLGENIYLGLDSTNGTEIIIYLLLQGLTKGPNL